MKHVSQFGLPKKRKQTLDILEKAFTEGNLDPHDYENRLDMVMQADSVEKLDSVLSDFPDNYGLLTSENKDILNTLPTENATQNHDRLELTVLGGKKSIVTNISNDASRYFVFVGEQKITFKDESFQNKKSDFEVVTVVGETKIDLRNKCLEGAVIKLRITKVMGEMNIKVAPGTIVEDHTKKILSEYNHFYKSKKWTQKISNAFSSKSTAELKPSKDPVNCLLILEGLSVMGNISIEVVDI